MDDVIRKLSDDAKAENWVAVDEQLPATVKNPIYVQWAYDRALSSNNSNLKDLGASMLEKAIIEEAQFARMRGKLYYRMMEETNQYVRFRSAFALAAHGPGIYKDQVITVLKEASHDKEVGIYAKAYLKQLKT